MITTFSCSIKEDWDDCIDEPYAAIHLQFECINKNYLFEEEVQELNLLFYTPEGTLAYDLVYTRQQLEENGWKVTLTDQQEGPYTLITHVNYDNGHTSVWGKEQKESLHTEIHYDDNRNVQYNLTHTYYGLYELELDYQAESTTHTVMLSKNTNLVSLLILFEEKEQYEGIEDLNIDIKGTNALYGWDNRELTHPPVKYYAPQGADYDDEKYRIHNINSTMRIQTWSDLKLEISFTNRYGYYQYEIDLPAEIVKVEENGVFLHDTDEKLEHYDHFAFELKFKPGNVLMYVKLNGWYLIRQGNDL